MLPKQNYSFSLCLALNPTNSPIKSTAIMKWANSDKVQCRNPRENNVGEHNQTFLSWIETG